MKHELAQRERKPEAQYSPWLFVQNQFASKRTADKAKAAELVVELAKERGIPIHTVDKGVLNTLSGDRPHQGYVLRCGKLDFESISSVPLLQIHQIADNTVVICAYVQSTYMLKSTLCQIHRKNWHVIAPNCVSIAHLQLH